MNNKKFFIIVLAFILAIVVASCIVKRNNSNVIQEVQNQEIIENKTIENSCNSEEFSINTEIKESKTPVNKPVNSTSHNKEIITPEENINEDSQKVEAEISIEEQLDAGIMRDSNTNEIIITREFKMKSPAKYFFK